jgi:hypothetical protein
MSVDLETLEEAAAFPHRVVPPAPQYCWPLLSRLVGRIGLLEWPSRNKIASSCTSGW